MRGYCNLLLDIGIVDTQAELIQFLLDVLNDLATVSSCALGIACSSPSA